MPTDLARPATMLVRRSRSFQSKGRHPALGLRFAVRLTPLIEPVVSDPVAGGAPTQPAREEERVAAGGELVAPMTTTRRVASTVGAPLVTSATPWTIAAGDLAVAVAGAVVSRAAINANDRDICFLSLLPLHKEIGRSFTTL